MDVVTGMEEHLHAKTTCLGGKARRRGLDSAELAESGVRRRLQGLTDTARAGRLAMDHVRSKQRPPAGGAPRPRPTLDCGQQRTTRPSLTCTRGYSTKSRTKLPIRPLEDHARLRALPRPLLTGPLQTVLV
jgi:hypothetical protein